MNIFDELSFIAFHRTIHRTIHRIIHRIIHRTIASSFHRINKIRTFAENLRYGILFFFQ